MHNRADVPVWGSSSDEGRRARSTHLPGPRTGKESTHWRNWLLPEHMRSMRPVERYKRNYRQFTWNNRIAYGAPVLTGRRDTGKDECSYYSVIAALESNLRIQQSFVDNLSIKYLKQKHVKVIQTNGALRRLGRVEQLLNMLKDIGVPSEHIYNLNLKVYMNWKMRRKERMREVGLVMQCA
ncbi:unnamed protein product [Miscanthus lutarioriparius]|uniref:Uncharacterized protein n=1 Tax=Miscanthus lutarioriparius TaxID=422564 RepID=A0A811RZN6_9POAL|nr:unnamed protein product [Miscanthus lutarioriparius]